MESPRVMATQWFGRLSLVLFLVALNGCARADLPCHASPQMFCAAFDQLRAELPDEELEEIKAYEVGGDHTYTADIGGYARAHLGLWEENEYTSFFRNYGIDHPDTMSAFLSDGFILYLNGKPVDMVEMLEKDRLRREELLRRSEGNK